MAEELMQGNLKPCNTCVAGKAKQNNVPKDSLHQVTTVNAARVFLDIVQVNGPEKGPTVTKPNWWIIVDERTQLKFSDFFNSKRNMVEPTCELFQ